MILLNIFKCVFIKIIHVNVTLINSNATMILLNILKCVFIKIIHVSLININVDGWTGDRTSRWLAITKLTMSLKIKSMAIVILQFTTESVLRGTVCVCVQVRDFF